MQPPVEQVAGGDVAQGPQHRVEIGAAMSEQLRSALTGLLGVEDEEVFPVDGLLDMGELWEIVKLPGHSELRDEALPAVTHQRLLRHDGDRPMAAPSSSVAPVTKSLAARSTSTMPSDGVSRIREASNDEPS